MSKSIGNYSNLATDNLVVSENIHAQTLKISPNILNNTSLVNGSVQTLTACVTIDAATISTGSRNVTYKNASSLYIAGPPKPDLKSNTLLKNSYALHVDSGRTFVDTLEISSKTIKPVGVAFDVVGEARCQSTLNLGGNLVYFGKGIIKSNSIKIGDMLYNKLLVFYASGEFVLPSAGDIVESDSTLLFENVLFNNSDGVVVVKCDGFEKTVPIGGFSLLSVVYSTGKLYYV